MLINTPAMPAAARFFAMRKSVKGFTDSLLDLIVNDRYCTYCVLKSVRSLCCVLNLTKLINRTIKSYFSLHLNMIVPNHMLKYSAKWHSYGPTAMSNDYCSYCNWICNFASNSRILPLLIHPDNYDYCHYYYYYHIIIIIIITITIIIIILSLSLLLSYHHYYYYYYHIIIITIIIIVWRI